MVNWSSVEEIEKDLEVYKSFLFVILGLWAWEYMITLPFEWKIYTRQIPFRWPMCLYFLTRYSLIGSLCTAILTNHSEPYTLNCRWMMYATVFFAGGAVYWASSIFVLRTIAVWGRRLYIVIPLVTMWLTLVAMWSWNFVALDNVLVPGHGCQILKVHDFFVAPYIVTEIVDAIVTFLCIYKLMATQGVAISSLADLLVRDGMYYFLVTFTVNTMSAVFILIWRRQNPVMATMLSIFALTVGAIMACRAFIRLSSGELVKASRTTKQQTSGQFWRDWTGGRSHVGPLDSQQHYRSNTGDFPLGGKSQRQNDQVGTPSVMIHTYTHTDNNNGKYEDEASFRTGSNMGDMPGNSAAPFNSSWNSPQMPQRTPSVNFGYEDARRPIQRSGHAL